MDKTDSRREEIINLIEKELIGPDPIDWEGLLQENGEEILVSDPPKSRYIAGVLYPKYSPVNDAELSDEDGVNNFDDRSDNTDTSVSEIIFSSDKQEYLEDMEELIDRSNAYNQSAMSLTVAVKKGDIIRIKVQAAEYESFREGKRNKYKRKPVYWESDSPVNLPTADNKLEKISIENSFLQVDFILRMQKEKYDIFTVTLENKRERRKGFDNVNDDECYFQAKMELSSESGFHPLPDNSRINADEDYLSNQLLYRNTHSYAIGHGCAADWKELDGKVHLVSTAVFPVFEVKPIVPSAFEGLSLSMKDMATPALFGKTKNDLLQLCEKYNQWIAELVRRKDSLSKNHIKTAERHINNCLACLERMRRGIHLLEEDKTVRQAFQWMNEAMLLQQLHFNLPLRKWVKGKDNEIQLELELPLPIIEDERTWFDIDHHHYGSWRPFQIAFILMNLRSMYLKEDPEREIVDLIWFPTGGGKTEAYLGLSAYTIFIRRLKDQSNTGTAIIMRYTLRLLTAQQYERASAMICACELIRKKNEVVLGKDRISIGLWVGGDTTPNSQAGAKGAVKVYENLYNRKTNDNPFVLLKCPWCGAQMGIVDIDGMPRRLPGYKKRRLGARKYEFAFSCENYSCDFYDRNTLPLYVVDEDIYKYKPTLLLGTVDKFAVLPFKPEAKGLFGFDDIGLKTTSPDLIIQDELHLISGPLGSMVGHYETLINDLCAEKAGNRKIYPKIIASTATISRAREQCHALYACKEENVFQFPPSGLDAGDSFFAKEDSNSNGRKYVGILASNSPSDATTAIRLYAALLYAAKKINVEDEKERDPYWTNVGYFNSIRELGQARTWIKADIDQHLDVMYKRRYDDQRYESREEYRASRRYIYRDEELTSRIPGNRVTESLSNLNLRYPQKSDSNTEYPIDVCLATNMISVGLDVPRLGLMTVSGQPKTTSEYIQATSRVGRDAGNAPGLIFVIYRPGRPRDKSYYEQFINYHSKLYSHVEPTSVTPFAAPVRDRALMGIMTGMIRLENGNQVSENPPLFPDDKIIDHVYSIIEYRVNHTDPDELDDTLNELDYLLQQWKDWSPERWTPDINYGGSYGDSLPLLYGAGSNPNLVWGGRGFAIPTSMRSVDSSCEAKVLVNRYENPEEE